MEQIKSDAPMIVRLVSGETVIAMVQGHDTHLELKRPAMGLFDQEGKFGMLDFIPFAPKGQKTIQISWQHVLFFHPAIPDIENLYRKNFTDSGLIVAPADSLPPMEQPGTGRGRLRLT